MSENSASRESEFTFADSVLGSWSIFSPNCNYLAIASASRLTVRDVKSSQVLHIFSCIDKIEKLEFSPDSQFIMCAMISRNAVQIFSLHDGEWRCRLNEGVAGMINALWSPNSRYVLTESDFGIQLNVWSLLDSSTTVISSPKQPSVSNGMEASVFSRVNPTILGSPLCNYSDCRRYMALVHRIESRDHIGIYSCDPWGELQKFACKSNDISQIQWTPDSTHILAIDSPLTYRIGVYTTMGALVGVIEPYANALGVRSLSVHRAPLSVNINNISLVGATSASNSSGSFTYPIPPLQQLLAVASYDNSVRLVTMGSWKVGFVLPLVLHSDLPPGLCPAGFLPTVEVAYGEGRDSGFGHQLDMPLHRRKNFTAMGSFSMRELRALPRRIAVAAPKSAPLTGVSYVGWSGDGSMLAARSDTHPQCLWIWQALEARLVALIVTLDAIVCCRWRPLVVGAVKHTPLLAYAAGGTRIYFWSPTQGSYWTDLPSSHSQMAVSTVTWSSDGSKLLLQGRESLCVLTLSLSESLSRPALSDATLSSASTNLSDNFSVF